MFEPWFELFTMALKSAQTGKPVCYYVVRVCFLYIVLDICRLQVFSVFQ